MRKKAGDRETGVLGIERKIRRLDRREVAKRGIFQLSRKKYVVCFTVLQTKSNRLYRWSNMFVSTVKRHASFFRNVQMCCSSRRPTKRRIFNRVKDKRIIPRRMKVFIETLF